MTAVYLNNITVTTGQTNVTVNSTEDITSYVEGDLIHVIGQLPLVIFSISGRVITLKQNATYSFSGEGLLTAQNIKLREALTIIEKNNRDWALNFRAFLTWVSSENDTEPLNNADGNVMNVYTPFKLNALAQNINTAAGLLGTLEQDVTNLSNTVAGQQSSLDASRNAAIDAKNDAEAAKAHIDPLKADFDTKYNDFNTRYLGSHTSAPVATNEGQMYWNETTNQLFTWDGTAWRDYSKEASDSATTASQASTAAVNAKNSIDTRYLGGLATAPASPTEGLAYTHTPSGEFRIYVGGTWKAPIKLTQTNLTDSEAAAALAVSSKDTALATTGFDGDWNAGIGVKNKPYSTQHNNGIYMLKVDGLNVGQNEPSDADTTNWARIGSVGGAASDSSHLGGIPAADYMKRTGGIITGNVTFNDGVSLVFGTTRTSDIYSDGTDTILSLDDDSSFLIKNRLSLNATVFAFNGQTGILNINGHYQEGGVRVYSPNNKPDLDDLSGTAANATKLANIDAARYMKYNYVSNLTSTNLKGSLHADGSNLHIVDKWSGNIAVTLDEPTFKTGDIVKVARLEEAAGTIEVITTQGSILHNGVDVSDTHANGKSVTMNSGKYVAVFRKINLTDWLLSFEPV